jgi:hypothetical protein
VPQSMQSNDASRFFREFKAALTAAMKQEGFPATLKALKRGRLPAGELSSIHGGVAEKKASGLYDAALETDDGPIFLENARPRGHKSADSQLISRTGEQRDLAPDVDKVSAADLLQRLNGAGVNPPPSLICLVELTSFDPSQHEVLLSLLWRYILAHRDSNNRDELAATGAAIRKYIAIMPMDRMGELAVLLESGHRSPLPIDLEIEVAKMVFRNFEVHPPAAIDTQPELAQRLWEMVQAYVNPRILLRDKHSAAASLAIEAIVAMRSSLAVEAWQAAARCPYRWFAELVSDDLDDLHEKWSHKHPEAAAWLGGLRSHVMAHA